MALVRVYNAGAYPNAVAGFFRSPTNQSVANNTYVKVTYGSTGYDHGSILDTANSRFVIPEDGIYIITFKAVYGSSSAGDRAWRIDRNAGFDFFKNVRAVTTAGSHEDELTYHSKCVVGDTIEFYWWQNSGGTLTGCFAECYIAKVGQT